MLKPEVKVGPTQKSNHLAEAHKEQKQTPFSQILEKSNGEMRKRKQTTELDEKEAMGNPKRPRNPILLMEIPSIKRFVDGPAHSLGPITQLAQQFVQACLARRRDRPS